MAALTLVLLSASLALAAPPTAWKDLAEYQDRHKKLAKDFEAVLLEMRGIRDAYPESKEKEVLSTRWDNAHVRCDNWLQMENMIRREHRELLNVLKLEILTIATPASRQNYDMAERNAFTTKLVINERQAKEMTAEKDRFSSHLAEEVAAFQALKEAQKGAVNHTLWGTAIFFLASLAAGVAFLFRRTTPAAITVAAVPVPALTGRTVSHANIELGELLGRGAMGEVYAGRDRTLDRRVAVKRLRPELSSSPAELGKLIAQARLMAGLKHPGIVQVNSVERDGADAFLVLELAEGRTLAKLLAEKGPLPWEDARRTVRAVAEALDYAHVRGVLHSDLKPSNIMVADNGNVKVMDFALAYAAKATVSRLTRSDAFGGLPYMSPEQELGDPSPAADAYALAACFYEALTGKRPFPGPDFLEQKRAGRFAPASSSTQKLPPGADSLFGIAFHPDAERRFTGPAALAAAADTL